MSDVKVTPSDVVGMIQRGLMELNMYMNAPALELNTQAILHHMNDMMARVQFLEGMQREAAETQQNGEARAN